MIFDAYAYLAKLNSENGHPATTATTATNGQKMPAKIAKCRNVAGVATNPTLKPKTEGTHETHEISLHGTAPGGRLLTWTGKVVNLSEWRCLSQWDRHGSTGKQWSGITRQWELKP
jgi:hypothetical protein